MKVFRVLPGTMECKVQPHGAAGEMLKGEKPSRWPGVGYNGLLGPRLSPSG